MPDHTEPCRTLVESLLMVADTTLDLPDPLPCPPLDLLIALHDVVRAHMLSDVPYAARAARLAQHVAAAYPTDPLHWAQAHWSQASAMLYLPDYAGALAHYDSALAAYHEACKITAPQRPRRDIRAVHIVRVFCLSELGRYTEAQEAITTAEAWLQEQAEPDPYMQLTLLLNRSQLAGTMGQYTDMIVLADATIQLAEQLGFSDRAAQGWVNRANGCISLGHYPEARVAIEQAIVAATRAEESLTLARARACSVWLLHQQGQLFEALSELRAVTPDFAQAPGERATLLLEEATIAAQLQQLPEALHAARNAARLFHAQHMPGYSADAAMQAASVALRLGQLSNTQQLLASARRQLPAHGHALFDARIVLIETLLTIQQASRLSTAARRRLLRSQQQALMVALHTLATAQLALVLAEGQLIAAALDQALERPDAAIRQYQALLEHPHPAIRMQAHGELGRLLPAAQALPFLREAARLVVEQRRSLPMEEIQARYSSESVHYHMQLAAAALAIQDSDAALAAIWEAKAGAMLDLRAAGSNDQVIADIPVDTAKAELARIQRLMEEQLRLASHASAMAQHDTAQYHLHQLRQYEAALTTCSSELTDAARVLADRKGWQDIPERPTLQAALRPGMAALEWFQVDDVLYSIMISADQAPQVMRITEITTIARLLDRWNLVAHHAQGASQTHVEATIQQVLRALSDVLLLPWRDVLIPLQEVLLAPWDVLYQLPWTALVYQLATHVVVTLTPSAGLWAAAPPPLPPAIGPVRVLGFRGEGTSSLAYLDQELTAIAHHFPDAQIIEPASSSDLRLKPTPGLLHLASHGTTNPTAPLCSTIALADGPFLLLEAHRLDLHGTGLVVLSACETGTRPEHGDMVLALSGAFLCAGADMVIASLWRVSDQATAELMDGLYAGLAQGFNPAHALHTAQRALRNKYPLDWAAFQCWSGTSRTRLKQER